MEEEEAERWGHTKEPHPLLLSSPKTGIRARHRPSSRLSHYNWPCHSYSYTHTSPRSPTMHVKHRDRVQDRHLGIHAMLMAPSFTSCQCVLMNPYINIQVCVVSSACWQVTEDGSADRQTCVQTDREAKWTEIKAGRRINKDSVTCWKADRRTRTGG